MNITILGTGFAALTAVRTLRRQDRNVNITVISPKAEMIYLPSLIWLPSRLKSGDDLRVDLNNFFRRMNVNFVEGRVKRISDGGRTVELEDGTTHANDGLIIASGGRFIKKLPGIEHVITPCEGIPASEKIRDRLDAMSGGTIAIGFGGNPKEPAAMRGGPMFEFLFGIDTLLRRQGRRERFRLVFFNPAPEPGKRLGPQVPGKLVEMMAKKGIETHLGHKIKGFEEKKVITEGGEIEADLILFMPGMTGPAFAADSDLPLSEGGLIRADAHARVEGLEKTYVAGDAGSFPGPQWQAKQAHAADIQAEVAAINLLSELNGGTPQQTIRHELICIIDTLTHGILVKRTEKGTTLLPPCRLMHWAKMAFEWWYLRQYR